MTRRFTVINIAFTCERCGVVSTAAKGTCRNHCVSCLYSKHVDKEFPGDRESGCRGLMKPIELDYSGKKGYMITHECEVCSSRSANKAAPDDSIDTLCLLSSIHAS